MQYVITRMAPNAQGALDVAFPTWGLVAGPFGAQNLVLITVPDEDFKEASGVNVVGQTQKLSAWLAARGLLQARIDEIVTRWGDPDVTVAVDPAVLVRWKQAIDRRYREKAGGYNIGVG